MSARILETRGWITQKEASLKARAKALRLRAGGRAPHLAVLLVGEDPASQLYVKHKEAACRRVGISTQTLWMSCATQTTDLLGTIQRLNQDLTVDAILVQLPLPEHVDTQAVLASLDPRKDVDGLTPLNQGKLALGQPSLRPCTPAGVMRLLEHEGVPLKGCVAAVLGRSPLVGSPMAKLLLHAHATVIHLHSRTKDVAQWARQADVLVVAVGKPQMVDQHFIKPGAVVVDVGIHRQGEGLVGDVNRASVAQVAAALTPVPGGVGPLTIFSLLANVIEAAESLYVG